LGENRFKEYQKLIARIWENTDVKELDPWWEFSSAVQECPWKTKMGGLPNIFYIIRKPEPLGNFLPF
jgi:hypothetical protein